MCLPFPLLTTEEAWQLVETAPLPLTLEVEMMKDRPAESITMPVQTRKSSLRFGMMLFGLSSTAPLQQTYRETCYCHTTDSWLAQRDHKAPAVWATTTECMGQARSLQRVKWNQKEIELGQRQHPQCQHVSIPGTEASRHCHISHTSLHVHPATTHRTP